MQILSIPEYDTIIIQKLHIWIKFSIIELATASTASAQALLSTKKYKIFFSRLDTTQNLL
jgi:hypothetical protein